MNILVFGASGMIGGAIFQILSDNTDWSVYGTVRDESNKNYFSSKLSDDLFINIDILIKDNFDDIFSTIRPDIVINCIGITKHIPGSEDPLLAIPMNALFPHKLAKICKDYGCRLIHISTDCVFSGFKGNYLEKEQSDARDIYGKTKYLGEVDYPHAITLRTSTIGHEFHTKYGLLEWFLSQENQCKGYNRAYFSGLPTVVLAEVIRDSVIPDKTLSGLYHVGGNKISKYDLLCLIAEVYNKKINIQKSDEVMIDRSLNTDYFRSDSGYTAPEWSELINTMHSYI